MQSEESEAIEDEIDEDAAPAGSSWSLTLSDIYFLIADSMALDTFLIFTDTYTIYKDWHLENWVEMGYFIGRGGVNAFI